MPKYLPAFFHRYELFFRVIIGFFIGTQEHFAVLNGDEAIISRIVHFVVVAHDGFIASNVIFCSLYTLTFISKQIFCR
jgi:hypothetical protein